MQDDPDYSGQIAYEIDKEVQRIVKEQYERCKNILLEHKQQLLLIAEALLKEETLVAEQIKSLFNDGVLPDVDYDSAEVVSKDDTEFEDGKYGKSYEDVRREQSELGKKQPGYRNDDQDRSQDDDSSSEPSEDTGHEQAPNIDKPSNPSDPNDPSNRD